MSAYDPKQTFLAPAARAAIPSQAILSSGLVKNSLVQYRLSAFLGEKLAPASGAYRAFYDLAR